VTRSFRDFPRITVNPEVMMGKPCIRGMRVTVGMILRNLGAGVSIEELLETCLASERHVSLEPAA
jgi:uncharacterized protein (DUF433 family)